MSNDDWSDREIDDGGAAVEREIDRLKRVYQEHSTQLAKLASSAPTKVLARKYHDLIGDINRSILGLEDPSAIADRATHERPAPPSTPSRPAPSVASEVRLRTEPGTHAPDLDSGDSAFGRIALILGMAIVVIALLAFFVWKYGGEPRSDKAPAVQAIEDSTAPGAEQPSAATTPPRPALQATPEAQDFGVIYKGTRVAKSFDVTNNTDRNVTIQLERSKCRCLWFEYDGAIPAGGSVTVSVSVDGGRVEPGLLSEAIVITTRDAPRVATEVQITADIR